MKTSAKHLRKTAWLTAGFVAAIFVLTEPLLDALRLHLNYSASVPVGLYQETQIGPYAGFCLSERFIRAAVQAGMEISPGSCPGGVVPILKPLLPATPQRPVFFSEQGFAVAGKVIPNTAPKSHSSAGFPLTHYPFGTYTNGLWAVSEFNRNSFDSRYFGPVNPASVRFYVRPFFLF